MSSISGIANLKFKPIFDLEKKLKKMNTLQVHRGPDCEEMWIHDNKNVGFAHNRLILCDIDNGTQPMCLDDGSWICYNGAINNCSELRDQLGGTFRTDSDAEVILHAYQKWGESCVTHISGMFSFAIWDETHNKLFCSRDRFGIKPFYYFHYGDLFAFASEMKALLPFLGSIETDPQGLLDYLTFQFCLCGKTLFKGVKELQPAHSISVSRNTINEYRYWQIYYNLDWEHSKKFFSEKLEHLIKESVRKNIRSDVPIGTFLSGGIDSSIISGLASSYSMDLVGFTGKFSESKDYDESSFAEDVACKYGFPLYQLDINSNDFIDNIDHVIFHLDTPVAGPGAFCQYMVSEMASHHRKLVLGGQGGDEIFGGYIRYLVAYFEQCIKGAIDGTTNSGNFIVTYESIIPNLISLRNYKPMLKEFWSEGLFDEPDKRYFSLINRAPHLNECIRWKELGDYSPYDTYRSIFIADNTKNVSYFDSMTHFDIKTQLPALLQVDDRMSMAHSIETRVPFLSHELVEFVATIPSNFKLKDGNMKYILKHTMGKYLPESVRQRKDKMGFPLPLNEWIKKEARSFIMDVFSSTKAKQREYTDSSLIPELMESESQFGRNIWALLCLELWHTVFHDNAASYTF